MDAMRHPDPAGCTLGSLLQAVNEHIHEEQTSILAYQRLGRTFADPVIAAVMQLILDDEARHHAAMQHIARTLNSALCWAPPPETTPLAAEDVSEAIRELRSLADEERRGVSALHELARRGRDRNDDLCAVLLDAMAMDSDKHARLLELVIRRLAAYAPKPLPQTWTEFSVSDVSRTEIVLAVVERNGRICLARRSEQVATGRGLWSVVTGYLEAGISSLEQASQELLEEFGLASPDVRLVRALPPVPLSSPVSGKHFLVHPFLFESSVDCEVVLNWEHTDFAWVEPARLGDGDCVSWQHDIVLALLSQHPVENRHLVFTRNARQSPSPWRVSMSGEPGHATGPVESTLETPKGRTRSPPRTRQG